MSTQIHYERWYRFAFLFLELFQAAIGIVTLTKYTPALTVKFAQWYARRRLRVTTW